ncbi:hypothetical protein E4U16_002654 [Claviceps sp. LM84 group G4]|nr:hypothetical protein E4U16_002654 [Claviceps sp. LM84 group G4]
MASFARSFKPPVALLSPRRRPRMTARTLSSSSELSLASIATSAHQTDYFVDRPVTSAPNSSSLSPTVGPLLEEGPQPVAGSHKVALDSPRANSNGPGPIDIPKPRKISSNRTCTPLEPLSARGDLPGAYFPLHEDPKERIRRPHPFACEAPHSHPARVSETVAMHAERARSSHASLSASVAHSSTPVLTYIAPGFHDAPLPLGKYYPTNYAQQHPHQDASPHATPVAQSVLCSVKSDSAMPQGRSEFHRSESFQMDMRRRMLQYQRDMIAQASMVLDATTRTASPGVSLNGLPIKDIWLSGTLSNKPLSPRLHPLGSPGPVTPMELDSNGCSYVETGTIPLPVSLGGLAPSGGARPNSA